jgi:dimeric dUTPase (all-alpha-NTP-PPase superfamily)
MPLNNQELTNKTTLYSLLQALKDTINYNMNCVKVATVIEFNPENLTVKCRVNNKRLKQLKQDGNQILEEYPDIYAKVHFFGWGGIGSVYPIEPGMEGILLFNDRELETWYLTSNGGKLAYDRCHDLSDALFICGVHSQPKLPLVPFIEACLHIYYKGSDVQIKDESITTNTKEYELNAETSIKENTKDYTLNALTTISETAPSVTITGSATTTVNGTTNLNLNGATITQTGNKIYLVCDDLIINGQSYYDHKHTGNEGRPTSGVITS